MQAGTTIVSIEIYKLFVPLKEPFIISLGPINEVRNIVVIIRTKDGCTGYGECSPFMSINGESIDTCFIVGQYFAKVLMGNDATDIEGCMKIMDKTIYGNTSIKSAFDIALHDIAAQNAGLPIYKFLGGEKNKVLETDMTISIGDPEKMKADAIRFKAEGFPAIKVKLSGDVAADFKRITYIREGIGMETPLQLDANQGWEEASRALEILTMLKDFNIRFCEEPILRSNYMELPQLKKASPIPIMADECCGDHVDAKRLIDLDACHMFNIKLGKSSGFFKGKKIAELGAAHQMQMQVGGFMESKLGMTAAAHLALHNEYIRYCDFDTPLMFTEDPVVGGIEYRENGVIEVPETPGLGAVIDHSYLAKAEKFIFN